MTLPRFLARWWPLLTAILYLESSPGTLVVTTSAIALSPPGRRVTVERVTECRLWPDAPGWAVYRARVPTTGRGVDRVSVRAVKGPRPCFVTMRVRWR